ncbi:MAG: hypothetical protein AAB906_03415 [Patescibacteria group bacterium]
MKSTKNAEVGNRAPKAPTRTPQQNKAKEREMLKKPNLSTNTKSPIKMLSTYSTIARTNLETGGASGA